MFSRNIYMKIEFSSQRIETLLFLTLTHHQYGRRDVTCKPAIINWEKWRSMRQGLVAGFAKMKACNDKFRPSTSQANCFEGFCRTTSKIKVKNEVRKQKKSLRAIRRAGYVCHTNSSNAMNSFSLSLLPSKHCLFWCTYMFGCFNLIFRWETKNNRVMTPKCQVSFRLI